jgi:hypothetical protein
MFVDLARQDAEIESQVKPVPASQRRREEIVHEAKYRASNSEFGIRNSDFGIPTLHPSSSEFSVLSFELSPKREPSAEGRVDTQNSYLKTQHSRARPRSDVDE